MHIGHHHPHRAALRRVGAATSAPLRQDTRQAGLPGQQADKAVAAVGHRRQADHAVARQVAHQVQIVGQLFQLERFKQGQHIAALRGGDKVIGVGDAGSDAFSSTNWPRVYCASQLSSSAWVTVV